MAWPAPIPGPARPRSRARPCSRASPLSSRPPPSPTQGAGFQPSPGTPRSPAASHQACRSATTAQRRAARRCCCCRWGAACPVRPGLLEPRRSGRLLEPKDHLRAGRRGIKLLRSAWSRPGPDYGATALDSTGPPSLSEYPPSSLSIPGVSSRGAGAGPDQPRSQPARLTRTKVSPATVLICLSTRPLTSPAPLWNRAISGAEVRILDRCSTGTALTVDVTSIVCRCSHHYTVEPHLFGPHVRGDRAVREPFGNLHSGDVEYST